jgi:hypothetical protein
MNGSDRTVEVIRTDKTQKIYYKWFYYFTEIKPQKVKFENKLYKIDNSYGMTVKGFIVTTINNKIEVVNVLGYHPNAAPLSNHLALPTNVIYKEFNKESYKLIKQLIERFDLDRPYFFNPTNEMKVRWWDGIYEHT